jgi:hypothetical protein
MHAVGEITFEDHRTFVFTDGRWYWMECTCGVTCSRRRSEELSTDAAFAHVAAVMNDDVSYEPCRR